MKYVQQCPMAQQCNPKAGTLAGDVRRTFQLSLGLYMPKYFLTFENLYLCQQLRFHTEKVELSLEAPR